MHCIRTAFQPLPPERLSAPLFSLPSSRVLISHDKISKDREKLPELYSQQQLVNGQVEFPLPGLGMPHVFRRSNNSKFSNVGSSFSSLQGGLEQDRVITRCPAPPPP